MRSVLALVLAVALSACTAVAPSSTPGAPGPLANTPAPPSGGAASATPAATLPGGLAVRAGLPPLVDGEAAACIPLCAPGRVHGGKLPAGRYQTEWFFGGYMTLETDGSWERTEDSDGELSLPVSGSGDDTYRLAFFLDPALVIDDKIQDVPLNAKAYVEWLADHPQLVVRQSIAARVGSMPATAIDISLSPTASRQYDDCPAACVTFLKVAAFDHSDGILGDDVYRFYLVDVSYSGSDHMLVVKVEGRDRRDLANVLERVEPMLETVEAPAMAGHLGG